MNTQECWKCTNDVTEDVLCWECCKKQGIDENKDIVKNISIEKIADTLVSQAAFFRCSLEEAWETYLHPYSTKHTTFEEVKKYIDDKVSLGEKYPSS